MADLATQPPWEDSTAAPVAVSQTSSVPPWEQTSTTQTTSTPPWEVASAPQSTSTPPWETSSQTTPTAPVTTEAKHGLLYDLAGISPVVDFYRSIGQGERSKLGTILENSTVGQLGKAVLSDIVYPIDPKEGSALLPKGAVQGNAAYSLIGKSIYNMQDEVEQATDVLTQHPIDTLSSVLHQTKASLSSGLHGLVTHPMNTVLEMGAGIVGNPQYALGFGSEGAATDIGESFLKKTAGFLAHQGANIGVAAPVAAATSVFQQTALKGFADPKQTAEDTIGVTSTLEALHLLGAGSRFVKSVKEGTESPLNVDATPTPSNEGYGGLMTSNQEAFDQFDVYAPKLQQHIEAVNDSVSVAPKDPSTPLGKNQETELLHQVSQSPSEVTKPYFDNLVDFANGHNVNPQDVAGLRDEILNNGNDIHGWLNEQLAGRIGNRMQMARMAETKGESFDPEDLSDSLLPKDVQEQYIADSNYKFRQAAYGEVDPNRPLRAPGQQGGVVDPKLALGLAGVVAGATYGFTQAGLQGAVNGGLLGGAALGLTAYMSNLGEVFNRSLKGDPALFRGTIKPFLEKWDGDLGVMDHRVSKFMAVMRQSFTPEEAQQMEQFKQGDPTVPFTNLSDKQKEFLNQSDTLLKQYGQALRKRGLINEPMHDYWARTFETTEDTPADIADYFRNGDSAKLAPSSRHFLSRSLANGWEGVTDAKNRLGLKLKEQDAITNLGNYLRSSSKAIVNFDMYRDLKRLKDINGQKLILSSADKVPKNYREISGKYLNKMQGIMPSEAAGLKGGNFINRNLSWYAHPSMSEFLNFLSDAKRPGALGAAIDTAQFAIKRAILFSGFHAKTLVQHGIVANYSLGEGVNTFNDAAATLAGTHPIFKQVLFGKTGDIVEQFIRNGGTIAPPEDVGARQFYEGVDNFSKVVNEKFGALGNPIVEGTQFFKDLAQRFDHITWQRAMTGGKLITFANYMEKEILRNQKNVNLNPEKFRQVSMEEIAKGLTPTINDFFGGQNWVRMSMDSSSEWMRNIKANLFKPNSRVWVQRAMFAPDWFISNFRAASRVLPSWETFKQAMHGEKNANTAMMKYHAYFAARAAFTYVVAADTLNKILSGHHIWQNRDPGTVELDPDGTRTANLDKALTDDIELAIHPIKRIYNAAGIFPKEAVEQIDNRQYIDFGPGNAPPIATWDSKHTVLANIWNNAGNRLGHFASKALPIAARVSFEGPQGTTGISGESLFNAASGFAGFPIYEHRTGKNFPRFLATKEEHY